MVPVSKAAANAKELQDHLKTDPQHKAFVDVAFQGAFGALPVPAVATQKIVNEDDHPRRGRNLRRRRSASGTAWRDHPANHAGAAGRRRESRARGEQPGAPRRQGSPGQRERSGRGKMAERSETKLRVKGLEHCDPGGRRRRVEAGAGARGGRDLFFSSCPAQPGDVVAGRTASSTASGTPSGPPGTVLSIPTFTLPGPGGAVRSGTYH